MIITKEDIENYIMAEIDPAFDSQINSWIKAVEGYIEKYLDYQLIMDETATTRYFDGTGAPSLLIDTCRDVIECRISEDLIEEEGYIAFPYNKPAKWQIRRKTGCFPGGVGNVTVKAKWGAYPEAEIPDDIRLAATILTTAILNSAKNPATGPEVKSETIGRYSVSYVTTEERSKLMQAKDLLEQYRRLSV